MLDGLPPKCLLVAPSGSVTLIRFFLKKIGNFVASKDKL